MRHAIRANQSQSEPITLGVDTCDGRRSKRGRDARRVGRGSRGPGYRYSGHALERRVGRGGLLPMSRVLHIRQLLVLHIRQCPILVPSRQMGGAQRRRAYHKPNARRAIAFVVAVAAATAATATGAGAGAAAPASP